MPSYVLNDGTYNVQEFRSSTDSASARLEMYGTQQVKIKLLFESHEVISDNVDMKITDWRYEAPFINMLIHGRSIQEETGTVTIKSKTR